MLQERLGPSLAELGVPVKAQIEAICATLARTWEVDADPRLLSGADKAQRLAAFIAATWEEVDRPCSERVVAQALSYADARGAAFDPKSSVLVHGDAQSSNTLSAGTGFKFVDPDGLFAERAYDLAIPMREWSRELLDGDALRLGRERCAYLSRLTGVAERPIWEWGFVERVSTGLFAIQVGAGDMGRAMLQVSEEWAR